MLHLPGTNGPNSYEGGTPFFDLDTYADLGTVDSFMPYFISDDQYQTVMNVNVVKGRHNIRFGTDIYYQALNHAQPEITAATASARAAASASGPARRRSRGTGRQSYNAFASFLLGVPDQIGRLKLVEPYTTRNRQDSLYIRDQWQARREADRVVRHPVGVFPGTYARASRSRAVRCEHQPMMVGGVGSVPKDLGVKVSKTLFAPRLGMTYPPDRWAGASRRVRHHQRSVRAGEAAAHESSGGAESAPRRAELAGLREPNVGRHPAIPDPDLGNGLISVPARSPCSRCPTISCAATSDRGTSRCRKNCAGGSSGKRRTSPHARSISSGSAN